MKIGVNKVIIVGFVGSDPEIKYLPNTGDAVATLSIATSEKWVDKTTGEERSDTQWHYIKCFRKLAEIVQEHVKSGRQLYVEGSLKYRKWTDNDGVDRYSTEIIASELQFLGKKDQD